MKTIEIKLYEFSELSENAKENAIENYRNNFLNFDFYTSEWTESLNEFCNLFDITWSSFDPENMHRSKYSLKLPDEILELSGLRLQKYIWNNFKRSIYQGKYYSLRSKKDISYKYHKEGYPVIKSRHSKIFLEETCVFTGVCYDLDLLDPIYKFMREKPDPNVNFEDLLNECLNSLGSSVRSEIEYRSSDNGIIEEIECNDYDFTENGEIY